MVHFTDQFCFDVIPFLIYISLQTLHMPRQLCKRLSLSVYYNFNRTMISLEFESQHKNISKSRGPNGCCPDPRWELHQPWQCSHKEIFMTGKEPWQYDHQQNFGQLWEEFYSWIGLDWICLTTTHVLQDILTVLPLYPPKAAPFIGKHTCLRISKTHSSIMITHINRSPTHCAKKNHWENNVFANNQNKTK